MSDLRQKTIRGVSARAGAQVVGLLLRLGSLMILARLLSARDFGLVGMVTSLTGIVDILRDFGLSAASVQRDQVTQEQVSTLFWINLAFGALLTAFTIAIAPLVGALYEQPRLALVTSVVGISFIVNGAGVQHSALLQRQMRFTALALIDVTALAIASLTAIVMARVGFGYWALAAMTVMLPLITTLGLWATTGWIPGWPRRQSGIRSMLHFGSVLTLNSVILSIAGNLDKILLGRFWGAEATGIYTRAFQLIRVPTDGFNSAMGAVAFAALSRLQDDPERLRRYFLRGYGTVVAFTLPLTTACALYANDIVLVLLGPKWGKAAPLFRILAPTILAFAMANPFGWLLNSLGLVRRSLQIALVFTPILAFSYALALPYGPQGIAAAYSAVMTLGLIPISAWAVHGTVVSSRDILAALRCPLAATLVAVVIGFPAHAWLQTLPLLPRLLSEMTLFGLSYAGVLLCLSGRNSDYLTSLRLLMKSSSTPIG